MPGGSGRSRRRRTRSNPAQRADRDGVLELRLGEGLDRHAVEALALEIRRLATRLGLEVKELQVRATEEGPSM
jgi:hypothetical protein